MTNQYVNSYKRLWGGDEAPSYVCWGHNNRSALVRVPMHKPGKAQSVRVEYRSLDPCANPYLALAVILAAGMRGIEEGYELPPEAEDDVWALSDGERKALGIGALPTSLKSTVATISNSDLVADTLGEDAFEFFFQRILINPEIDDNGRAIIPSSTDTPPTDTSILIDAPNK